MGVFWYSKAEVISTEPEVIKKLIEEIAEVLVENEDSADGTRIKFRKAVKKQQLFVI